jgi:DnaJ-domain-containing protein 1
MVAEANGSLSGMTDYFALLNEPRRPWLAAGLLKVKFFALSAQVHPDKVHGATEREKHRAHERYTELNAAYTCLREPTDRLRHLLQLESGRKPKEVHDIPAPAADLFLEVARLCREVESFLAERSRVASPLLKVQMFERGQDWMDRLSTLQQRLGAGYDALMDELKAMNASWEQAPAVSATDRNDSLPLDRLEQIYRALSFMTRWRNQVQERMAQLAQ